jgi:hypothetical protein
MDGFVYAFRVGDELAVLNELDLTPELQQLARLVLDDER